jgi:hypothetical protein
MLAPKHHSRRHVLNDICLLSAEMQCDGQIYRPKSTSEPNEICRGYVDAQVILEITIAPRFEQREVSGGHTILLRGDRFLTQWHRATDRSLRLTRERSIQEHMMLSSRMLTLRARRHHISYLRRRFLSYAS